AEDLVLADAHGPVSRWGHGLSRGTPYIVGKGAPRPCTDSRGSLEKERIPVRIPPDARTKLGFMSFVRASGTGALPGLEGQQARRARNRHRKALAEGD